MNLEAILFLIAFVAYFGASVAYLFFTISKRNRLAGAGFLIAAAGFTAHTIALLLRIIEAQRLIGYGFYEYMSLFSWGTVLIFLILEQKNSIKIPGLFILPSAFILLGLASLLPKDIVPLVPIMRSIWLPIHIFTTVTAYSAFTFATGTAFFYLLVQGKDKKNNLSLHLIERAGGPVAAFGFFFLTLGIISGAVWAQYVWASFWSWDPKETASLVTWFIYAAFLHTRYVKNWKGKKSALLLIIGFISVLFTFVGIDLIVPKAHNFLFG